MKSDQTLILFTSSFPFGKGEQFIETEILYLAEHFREVHIFPLTSDHERRPVPANVKVCTHRLYQPYSRPRLLLSSLRTVLSVFAFERKHSPHRKKYSERFRYHVNYLLHRLNDAKWLNDELQKYDLSKTIVYSYWFNHWAEVLCLAKLRRKELAFFTRVHGGDYDEAQRKEGYFPFRYFGMQQVGAVYPVSFYGERYLRQHFPAYTNTLKVFHLGVNDHGDNPESGEAAFHIVSCSFLIPLKRVHLLVEILKKFSFPVRWTHFGDGELREEIHRRAQELPANVSYEFKGHVPNSEILRFYRENHVDLFVNVSELEGIPVSIMEAISFGIPSVGCAICGVPEIVMERTGFLLEKDFDPAEAAARIAAYQAQSLAEKEAFRAGVKQFWAEQFNSAVNYPAFIREFTASFS